MRFPIELLKTLCRIDLSPEEEKELQESLNRVLHSVEKLQEVDTEGVLPHRFAHAMTRSKLREDIAETTLSREKFLAGAPKEIGGMIRVPPILKDE